MSMDQFTAGQILAALKNGGDSDDVATLYKQLKGANDKGPNEEQVKFFLENEGKVVIIKGTGMSGIVTRLNTSTRGFYPGGRYPIYVKILTDNRTEHNSVGQTFEYDIDQLEVINITGE